MVKSKWFEHPESGQVFEAEGKEIEFAIGHGCIEVAKPKVGSPSKQKAGKDSLVENEENNPPAE